MRPLPLRLILSAVAMLMAAPAVAADHLDCALIQLDLPVRARIFEAFKQGRNIGEVLIQAREAELERCRAEHGWSDDAYASAIRVMFGDVLSDGFGRDLAARGVAMDKFRVTAGRFIAGFDADEQSKLADGELDPQAITILLMALEKDGALKVDGVDDALGQAIGAWLSARANMLHFTSLFAGQ
jgi:hypothetical protein